MKDHSGVKIPLSDILGLIDVDSPDFYASQNELIHSNYSFDTITPLEDYTWMGKELEKGKKEIVTIYFSVPDNINLETALMMLEVDFYYGGITTNSGIDIILYNRTK